MAQKLEIKFLDPPIESVIKERLFYIRPGDSARCWIEVERDEMGKFKEIRCPLFHDGYREFLIDEHSLLGKCSDPACRKPIQFYREPIVNASAPKPTPTPATDADSPKKSEIENSTEFERSASSQTEVEDVFSDMSEEIQEADETPGIQPSEETTEAFPLPEKENVEPGVELESASILKEIKNREIPTPATMGVLSEDKKRGWIKLWRKFKDSKYFKDSHMVHLIDYLLLKASHKDEEIIFNGKPLSLKRGELIFGREAAHRDTGISQKILRRRMQILETDNPPFLTRERPTSPCKLGANSVHLEANKRASIKEEKRASNFSIVRICNYEHYQGSLIDEGPAENESKGHTQNNGQGPAQGQPRATFKKLKKLKNIKHYVEGSTELCLASFLLEEIQKRRERLVLKPLPKKPDLQLWASYVELLLKDGRTEDQIREMIVWTQNDIFWGKNIRSTQKLREEFERLEEDMASKKKGKIPEQPKKVRDLTFSGDEI